MNKKNVLLSSVLVLTFLILSSTLQNGWTNLDDPIYILENPLIKDLSWSGVVNMFTTFQVNGSYNPLVLLSWSVDYFFSELNPTTFHATNLILHIIVTSLVFYLTLLLSKNKWIAFGTSLLFGIHPMHVEAVAWVTARKDLLYTLFYIASLIAYYFYLQQNAGNKWRYFVLCFSFFVLSLFSKGSAITLPLILWAIDYLTKRKGLKEILLEKIPFLVLSILFTIIAIKAQDLGEALQFREFYSVFDSLSVGFYGYFDYLIKLIAPYKLSALHPYPTPSGTPVPWYFTVAAIPVLAIAGYCFYKIRKARTLVFGFGFFFITLIPVIQVLSFAVSVTADRFTYLPYFGLFFLMSSGVFLMVKKKPQFKNATLILSIIFLTFLSIITFRYSKTWKNSETVWNKVLKFYPDYFVAYVNRAAYRINVGNYDEALKDCNKAISLKPNYHLAFYNRGYIYQELGNIEEAIKNYSQTIILKDDTSQAYQNRGILYVNLEKFEEAYNDFNSALKANPKDPIAYLNRASLLKDLKEYTKVIDDASAVISLDSTLLQAYYLRGISYAKENQNNKAILDLTKAIEDKSLSANALKERGYIYLRLKKDDEAINDFEASLNLDNNQLDLYLDKSELHIKRFEYDKALFSLERAERIDSKNNKIYYLRNIVYQQKGDTLTALKELERGMINQPQDSLLAEEKKNILKRISSYEK